MKAFRFKLNNKGTITLYTNRLTLRRFEINDAEQMFKNWAADEDVAKYTIWNVNSSINETREYINRWVSNYKNKDYYNWAIVENISQEVIGSISAFNIKYISRSCDIGYTLSKDYWNKGIATEATKEIIRFLINDIGFVKISAYHDIDNPASGRVLQKCGMKFSKVGPHLFLSSRRPLIECMYYTYRK